MPGPLDETDHLDAAWMVNGWRLDPGLGTDKSSHLADDVELTIRGIGEQGNQQIFQCNDADAQPD